MTEPTDPNRLDVQQRIAQLMRQRLIGFAAFVAAAALGAILAVVCISANKQRLAPIVFVPLIAIGLSALVRVFSTKCPACGKLFFGAPVRALYASSCYYCKAACSGAADTR
jgi:hypothetical protein